MKYLFIFNDSPYGSQRAYNGLRLAAAVARKSKVQVFLLGDGILCGIAGLSPAHADYNPQELLHVISETGAELSACGTCMEARGVSDAQLIACIKRSTMDQLVAWTEDADKIISL